MISDLRQIERTVAQINKRLDRPILYTSLSTNQNIKETEELKAIRRELMLEYLYLKEVNK